MHLLFAWPASHLQKASRIVCGLAESVARIGEFLLRKAVRSLQDVAGHRRAGAAGGKRDEKQQEQCIRHGFLFAWKPLK